jgi:hypothetical protein
MMKIRIVCFVIVSSLLSGVGGAEIRSLSHLFLLGKGVEDTDQDSWPDRVGFRIIIPDEPGAASAVLAADIAARANFECLAQDPALVRLQSEPSASQPGDSFVFIGPELESAQAWCRKAGFDLPPLQPHQGAVVLLGPEENGLAVVAGSDHALLKSGRAISGRFGAGRTA